MKDWKIVRTIMIVAFLICIGVGIGCVLYGRMSYEEKIEEVDQKDIVAYLITHHFILDNPYTKEELLSFDTPSKMVEALNDSSSSFMTKDEVDASIAHLNNTYVGLGFEGDKMSNKDFVVTNVLPSSPALSSGVVKGDVITHINGIQTFPMGNKECINLIRGNEGENVKLTIRRDDEVFDLDIKKRCVEGKIVESRMMDNEVGYISIRSFPPELYREVIEHLVSLKVNGMKKLIIDLRGNKDGDVKEVAPILSMILPYSKKVLYKVSHVDNADKKFRRSNEVVFLGPVVVLCNNETSSCAELFVAICNDFNRAVIVGDKTKGKQTTQTLYTFEDGSVLKLSTGLMFSAKDSFVEGKGIEPDVKVCMDSLLSRCGHINEDIDSYSSRMKGVKRVLIKKYGIEKAKFMIERGDEQLNKAYDIIKNTPQRVFGKMM